MELARCPDDDCGSAAPVISRWRHGIFHHHEDVPFWYHYYSLCNPFFNQGQAPRSHDAPCPIDREREEINNSTVNMWPYRPWLFKAQHGQQADNVGTNVNSTATTPTAGMSSDTNAPTQPQPQVQPPLRPRPQAATATSTRNWLRRYCPSINSRVYGYPSAGGVLILPGYDVDLPYLGLQRSIEATRANNVVEEDEFCRKLRYLGAIWWPYPDADLDALRGNGSPEDMERAATHVCVGWPSDGSGVWVLKYNERAIDDNDLSLRAQRIGPLNMNDRCRVIRDLGGQFYRHPDECEDLRWGNWL